MSKKRIEGLDEVFSESEMITSVFAERERAVQKPIPVDSLVPNRFNPRRNYEREALDELVRSIQEHGFIGALDGRQLPDGRIELAYGSRRLLAAKTAGIRSIPVFLHDEWDDHQLLFIALVENLVREDLSPQEEAETVGRLHEQLGLSVREIVRRTSKPKSWVEDRLALFHAPDDVKEMVAQRADAVRVANYIARLPDEESRRQLADRVVKEKMTTRQVQRAVQQVSQGKPVQKAVEQVTRPPEPKRVEPADLPSPSVGEGPPPQQADAVPAGQPSSPPPRLAVAPVPSSSRLLGQANESLARIDAEGVAQEDVQALLDLLRLLITRASLLQERLRARLPDDLA